MRLSKKEHTPKTPGPGFSAILFQVQGVRFALDATAVDEIRNLQGLVPFSPTWEHPRLAKVKFILRRPRITYFAIDAGMHFRMPPATPTRVMLLRGAPVAVLVDGIDRMTDLLSLRPLPMAFQGQERYWYQGLGLENGMVTPVVNAAAFLSRAEIIVLQQALGTWERSSAIPAAGA